MPEQADIKRTSIQPGMLPGTADLIAALKTGNPGDVLTDQKLSEIASRDTRCGHNGYAILCTAIKHVRRNFGKVWQRQRGADAIKCLTPTETIDSSRGDLRAVSRRARTPVQKLASLDLSKLENGQGATACALMAQAGTIAMLSRSDTTKKLEARKVQAEPLDLPKMLEMFKS